MLQVLHKAEPVARDCHAEQKFQSFRGKEIVVHDENLDRVHEAAHAGDGRTHEPKVENVEVFVLEAKAAPSEEGAKRIEWING